jgi:hypothetical protein
LDARCTLPTTPPRRIEREVRRGFLLAPAILIELGLEALWQSGLLALSRIIAPRAGHTGRAAFAGVGPVPRHLRVCFAHPTGVFAKSALHWSRFGF